MGRAKGVEVKLLLTSGGMTNDSIRDTLVGMLGKPIAESKALFIPTAQWGHPICTPVVGMGSIGGAGRSPGLSAWAGSRSECSNSPRCRASNDDRWVPWVRDADVLLVDGGEAIYLAHWMRESGLAALLPELTDTVWVGVSAGSMVMTPRIGRHFLDWKPDGPDETLGVVDFSIFPHLDYPGWSGNTLEAARGWAKTIPGGRTRSTSRPRSRSSTARSR